MVNSECPFFASTLIQKGHTESAIRDACCNSSEYPPPPLPQSVLHLFHAGRPVWPLRLVMVQASRVPQRDRTSVALKKAMRSVWFVYAGIAMHTLYGVHKPYSKTHGNRLLLNATQFYSMLHNAMKCYRLLHVLQCLHKTNQYASVCSLFQRNCM